MYPETTTEWMGCAVEQWMAQSRSFWQNAWEMKFPAELESTRASTIKETEWDRNRTAVLSEERMAG